MKKHFSRKTIFVVISLIFIFTLISCEVDLNYNNPLEPGVAINALSSLKIEFMTEDSVLISWKDNNHLLNDSQKQAVKIYIEQSIDGNAFFLIDSSNAGSSSKLIAGSFQRNSTYYFRLYEKAEENLSSSLIIKAKPSSFSPVLILVSLSESRVELFWSDSSIFTKRYIIETSYNGIDFSPFAIVDRNSKSYTKTGAFAPDIMYYFRMSSETEIGPSAFSNIEGRSIDGHSSSGIEMGFVEGGTFLMGVPDSLATNHESPQHYVTLSDYYIGKYEITQKQWREVVEWKQTHGGCELSTNPNTNNSDSLPVGNIDGADVHIWVGYLNEKEKTLSYRLPTEAEWEFAAMGGNYSHGYIFSGSDDSDAVGWFSVDNTHKGGLKQPNEIGIFDMSGNAMEMTSDVYYDYTTEPQVNPSYPPEVLYRTNWVYRGGHIHKRMGIKNRGFETNFDGRWNNLGFRIARSR